MYDVKMKGSTGKNFRIFSPRNMREKVNKMVSKVETLNYFALDPNWTWIYHGVILSRKNDSGDATPNFNQSWLY